MSEPASQVTVTDLSKDYGSGSAVVHALKNVTLTIAPGEFVAVMGPSGCGKSTLLNLIGTLDVPTSGEIEILGRPLSKLDDEARTRLRRTEIGFVFQFFNLIPVLDAQENAALPLLLDGARDAQQRAAEWLAKVGLAERLQARLDQLSGGEQQRVAIARALATEPALVLADEPTGNLDTAAATEIAELLRQVATDWNRSVLMVTHDPRIASFADRLIVLRDGVILDDLPLDGSRTAAAEAMDRLL